MREDAPWHWSIVITLWWVEEVLDHKGSLSLVGAQLAEELVFVNECDLCACGVHQDLMHHVVGHARVINHADENESPCRDHDWQHDRVGPVKRIFANQVCQHS